MTTKYLIKYSFAFGRRWDFRWDEWRIYDRTCVYSGALIDQLVSVVERKWDCVCVASGKLIDTASHTIIISQLNSIRLAFALPAEQPSAVSGSSSTHAPWFMHRIILTNGFYRLSFAFDDYVEWRVTSGGGTIPLIIDSHCQWLHFSIVAFRCHFDVRIHWISFTTYHVHYIVHDSHFVSIKWTGRTTFSILCFSFLPSLCFCRIRTRYARVSAYVTHQQTFTMYSLRCQMYENTLQLSRAHIAHT